MRNVNGNAQVLFLQKCDAKNNWFINLMTAVLIEDRETFSLYMRIKSKLENGQANHPESWDFIGILFAPYPILLMGISLFLVPQACYKIPADLLMDWRDSLLINGFVIREPDVLTMQNLYPCAVHNNDRSLLFMWFLERKANREASRLESYGRVLTMRFHFYKEYFRSLIQQQSPETKLHIITVHCRSAIVYLTQSLRSLSPKRDIQKQFLSIFFKFCARDLTVEGVCDEIFELFNNDRICITVLIDFNYCLQYLTLVECCNIDAPFPILSESLSAQNIILRYNRFANI